MGKSTDSRSLNLRNVCLDPSGGGETWISVTISSASRIVLKEPKSSSMGTVLVPLGPAISTRAPSATSTTPISDALTETQPQLKQRLASPSISLKPRPRVSSTAMLLSATGRLGISTRLVFLR